MRVVNKKALHRLVICMMDECRMAGYSRKRACASVQFQKKWNVLEWGLRNTSLIGRSLQA